MKRTQRIDLLASIRESAVSFFAITMFVALGVGFFLGIHWLGSSIHGMLDAKFAEGNEHALEITFPYGLTDEDLARLAQVEGVDQVEAGYLSFQELEVAGEKLVARVGELPRSMDLFVEVEGELPTRAGEVAVDWVAAQTYGLSLGDAIAFLPDAAEDATGEADPDGMAYLTRGAFTITAIVKSPSFLARFNGTYGTATVGTGTINVLAWVSEDAFDADAYQGGRPYVLVGSSELDGLSYASDAYRERSDALLARVSELGDELGPARYEALHTQAEQLVEEAERQLAEGERQIAEGERHLADGEAQLEEGRKTLRERIDEALAQISGGQELLDAARAAYAAGKDELAEALALLSQAELSYEQATQKLAVIRSIASDAQSQLQQIRAWRDDEQAKGDDELSEQMQALYDEWNAAFDVAYTWYDEQLAAIAAEHGIDFEDDDFWEKVGPYLADVDAELEERISAINAEFEERERELMAQADERLAQIQEEYDARLDALGASMEADLAAQGIELPFRLDHTNLDSLDLADDVIEQAKGYEIEVAGRKVSYDTAPALIAQYRAQIEDGRARLEELARQIASGAYEMSEAQETFDREVAEGERQIAEAEAQLEEGRTQLDEARGRLDEGRDQLEAGKASLNALVDYGWVVLPRTYNGAAIYSDMLAQVIGNLRWSMASLFLIVGILVCYSAVSRLVHEQITRIGTKKAMGFRQGEVSALFLWYAALCVAAGSLAGTAMAYLAVEPIILRTVNTRYVFDCRPGFGLADAALITALEFALILGSTWLAVRGVLRMQAVELLAGEKPPTAKARFYERWGVWRRMGLLAQTTVNNCVNDTRRVVASLIGVAGCTALIVCAVMLNDNVLRSFTRQYDAISHYDVVVNLTAGSDAAERGERALEQAGLEATPVQYQTLSLEQPDGTRSAVYVLVPMDEDEYAGFFSTIPTSGTAGAKDGIWVSQAYAEHFGAEPGDTLVVSDGMGNTYDIPIEGFFEYHLSSNQAMLSAASHERVFGRAATANRILVKAGGQGTEVVAEALDGLDGVVGVVDNHVKDRRNFDDFAALSRIMVMVYLALATAMAVCVLLNLDFMFVDEKKRELIVLMINGYSLRQAKGYVWHDSVVLTVLGILCGLALGNFVGGLTVLSAEQTNTSFLHDVSWLALGCGAAGSAVLATLALVVALRRIDRFDLTDINRF